MVLVAHVLEHAHRGHPVKALLPAVVELAVVHPFHLNRQALQSLVHPTGLLTGDRQPGDAYPVVLRGMPHQAAPAAANVQQGHARAQAEFSAHQVQLVPLRLLQIACLGPVAAAVGHGVAQHALEQLGIQVVVHTCHLRSPPAALQVAQACAQPRPGSGTPTHLRIQPRTQDAGEETVQLGAVPPTLDIAVTQAQAALRQHPGKRLGMVHLQVPRSVAIDADIGSVQQALGLGPGTAINSFVHRVRPHAGGLHAVVQGHARGRARLVQNGVWVRRGCHAPGCWGQARPVGLRVLTGGHRGLARPSAALIHLKPPEVALSSSEPAHFSKRWRTRCTRAYTKPTTGKTATAVTTSGCSVTLPNRCTPFIALAT